MFCDAPSQLILNKCMVISFDNLMLTLKQIPVF